MLLKALMELSGNGNQIEDALKKEDFSTGTHVHDHIQHGHGRSYERVRKLINDSSFSSHAKGIALAIYEIIAKAEAKVHGETLETIHFHEVGRDEAIKNALGIGAALEQIDPDEILTSPIYDGKGTVVCSHGEIPVPVPAVMALREDCDYQFKTADINMEMVTPSGLAGLIGIGAKPAAAIDSGNVVTGLDNVVMQTEAKGSRDTGRPGLRAYIIESE